MEIGDREKGYKKLAVEQKVTDDDDTLSLKDTWQWKVTNMLTSTTDYRYITGEVQKVISQLLRVILIKHLIFHILPNISATVVLLKQWLAHTTASVQSRQKEVWSHCTPLFSQFIHNALLTWSVSELGAAILAGWDYLNCYCNIS